MGNGRATPPPVRGNMGGKTAVFDCGLALADWGMGNGRTNPPPTRAKLGGETAVFYGGLGNGNGSFFFQD